MLFVDLKQKRTIFVTEDKDNLTVAKFAYDFQSHNGKVKDIKEVSCDISLLL